MSTLSERHDDATAAAATSAPGAAAFVPPVEFDDYTIVHELGRGAMGQVYLAEDTLLARPVAIKFIAGVDPDLEMRQRFLMEARAAARIQHPNVVGVYRVGELGDRPYIVSELVRGTSLAQLPRPMPWHAALDIAIELARGLAAAHRRGVVHCDIKPSNAMITDDNVAKLVDFGLARVVHEGSEDGSAGPIVGTPDYMAPEVWSGRAPSRRSDVYSSGAVLFELISGRPPFAEVAPAALGPTVIATPAPELLGRVPEVDARLSKLVARCLERDPELRFASGEELREALEQLHPSRAYAISSEENPYRGLRPFEASHRGLFFGRGLEIGAIVERLRTDAIVIVTGDSGVGKSSLCRAGVMPAVLDGALGAGRAWDAITMIPGRRPLAALAAAVGVPGLAARVLEDPEELPRELQRRAGDRGIVLFIDQMEELVTVADPIEVAALDAGLARISEGVPGIRLITTVRADFLSKIAALPRLGRELSRLLYFVSPLPPERIRDVVTGPAQATGVEFESPALIQALVEATTEAGSGGLPLLSFALAELWERRDRTRNLVTQASLDAMGGVAGALARHGDSVIAGMAAGDRANVRRVLLRLVTSVGTRVRRTQAELDVSAGARVALDALVKGRLLVVHHGDDGTTYEVAHEVLVHGWGTLREWLDNDAEDRARRERLAAATAEWLKHGKRSDLTWRGPRLVEARALDRTNLTALEHDFIAASVRSTARWRWIRRAAIAGVLGLLVVVYAVQHYLAQHRLERAVALEVDAARTSIDQAHAADRSQRELATAAYAQFDAGDAAAGEATW
ncbi:MAG: serine/threonine-protein kinase, partial [Myxococcota bacterium]|nr:serine/threonine-protein kinase [Myxococcota bacterium]